MPNLWNDIDGYNRSRITHLIRDHGYEVIVAYGRARFAWAVTHGPHLENGGFRSYDRGVSDVTDVTDSEGGS